LKDERSECKPDAKRERDSAKQQQGRSHQKLVHALKRILWVMPFVGRGGAERMTVDLTRELAQVFDITLLLFRPSVDYQMEVDPRIRIEVPLSKQARLRIAG